MPRRSGQRYVAVLVLLAAGCRSAVVDRPLSPAWVELARPPAPFAALYRLTCCGQRQLPTVVRSEGGRLAVSVSIPPGGVAWEAWFDADGGVVRSRGDRCVSEFPAGRVPLPGGATLPVDALLWATLLAGRLPPGVTPVEGRPGWLVGSVGRGRLAARCAGEPPRCLEIRLDEDELPGVVVRFDRHHGRVPGRIRAAAGRERLVLELAEWGPSSAVTAPEWSAWPRCAP